MGGWRVLRLSDRQDEAEQPILLVKHDFQQNRYAIYLTDLAHIWEESLDRKSIIKRALNDGTSIDPSEGADQLKVLLLHLSSAVSGDTGSVRLQNGSGHDTLNMSVIVALPEPLEPLAWTFSLRQSSSESLFQQLQVPLFERCFVRHVEVDSLLDHVAERDKIISRLVDKLEASGVDLTTIFPSIVAARGSRAAVREHLFRNVPGLRPFDKTEWMAKIGGSRWESREELLRRTLAAEESSPVSETWTLPKSWWKSLGDEGEIVKFPSTQVQLDSSIPSSPIPEGLSTSMLEEDDFQMQDISKLSRNTASSLRNLSSKVQVKDSQLAPDGQQTHSSGDSSTEDEVDLDAPPTAVAVSRPSSSNKSPEQNAAPAPQRKLGMLGGSKGKQTERPLSPPPARDAMELDAPQRRRRQTSLEPEPLPSPEKPRRKLGRIGGLTSTKPESDRDLPLRRSQELDERSKDESGDERPSRMAGKGRIATERETSTERADRLREELKRDLEEKRKAPAKKKRKF